MANEAPTLGFCFHLNYIRMDNTNEMLSEHFSLEEMTRSGEALRRKIGNEPAAGQVENLRQLCLNVLEPVRRRFGATRITSGYRCPELNEAVGGVADSQHIRGEAADIHISDMEVGRKMFDFIRRHTDFDQLLFERRVKGGCRWLHVSYTTRRPNRHEARELEVNN